MFDSGLVDPWLRFLGLGSGLEDGTAHSALGVLPFVARTRAQWFFWARDIFARVSAERARLTGFMIVAALTGSLINPGFRGGSPLGFPR
jgi:hypothetical protein